MNIKYKKNSFFTPCAACAAGRYTRAISNITNEYEYTGGARTGFWFYPFISYDKIKYLGSPPKRILAQQVLITDIKLHYRICIKGDLLTLDFNNDEV